MSTYSGDLPPMAQARASIPPIFTQWEPGQFARDVPSGFQRIPTGKKINEFLKANPSTGKQYMRADVVSPLTPAGRSVLTTPDSNKWAFDTFLSLRKSPSDLSVVDSVFELPSGVPDDSPASSTHEFIAELEDTSPIIVHSQRSAFPGAQLTFQSSTITSRAIIKAVDEAIASIEADNRKLLTRAVTAEHTVKVLRQHNSTLQLNADHCHQHHRRGIASSQSTQHRRIQQSPVVPLSTFNNTIDEISAPEGTPTRAAPLPLSQTCPTRTAPQSYRSPPSTPPSRPLPTPSPSPPKFARRPSPKKAPPCPPRTYPSPIDTTRVPTSNCTASMQNLSSPTPTNTRNITSPITTQHISPPIQTISSPIPGSVTKHRVTYQGAPVSFSPQPPIISLSEAQIKLKPLPPISPSALHGNVQIGLGIEENDLEKSMSKRKRAFSALFKKGRKASA